MSEFHTFEQAESPRVNIVVGSQRIGMTWRNTRLNTYSTPYAHMDYVMVSDGENNFAVYDRFDLIKQLRGMQYPEVKFPLPTQEEYERYANYGSALISSMEPEDFANPPKL